MIVLREQFVIVQRGEAERGSCWGLLKKSAATGVGKEVLITLYFTL